MKEFIKLIWNKFIIEAIIFLVLCVIFLIGKYLLPEKYKIRTTKFKEFLKTVSMLFASIPNKDDNIFMLFSKSKNIFENLFHMENTGISQSFELSDAVKTSPSHQYEIDGRFMYTFFPKFYHMAFKEEFLFQVTPEEKIVNYHFDLDGEIISIIAMRRAFSGQEINFLPSFGVTKGTSYKKLINLLFKQVENKLYLTVKNDKLEFQKLDMDFNQENYIPNTNLIETLRKEIDTFKHKGYQRSYILNGPPGTGKTTFCLEMSKTCSGKIIKVDSSVFAAIGDNSSRFLFDNLEADFIIVDDIDRMTPVDFSSLLYMLEAIKNFKTKPTLLVTVNNIQALDKAIIRPGRFDDIIEFNFPTNQERLVFIKNYLKAMGANELGAEEIKIFAEITEGMTQAYLKEYCLQLVIEDSPAKLFEKITKRKKYLEPQSKNPEPATEEKKTTDCNGYTEIDLCTGDDPDDPEDQDIII